jgi:hypothetical protein
MTSTAAPSAHGGVRSLTIGLPDDWTHLPLETGAFDRAVEAHRREWRAAGLGRTEQRRLEVLLQRVAGELRAVHVVFAASALLVDAGTVELQTCTLSTHAQADLGTDLRISTALLFQAFAPTRRAGDDDGPRITDLEPPELCPLPAGSAVRLRRLYEPRGAARGVQRFFGEAYVMPLGEEGSHAAMLQFATTALTRAGELSATYRDVADTLTFDDDTKRTVGSTGAGTTETADG